MRRAVYIGGFGNGRQNAARVQGALEEYYQQVDPFTFAQAMDNPDRIRRAVKGVPVVTHSAGMLALYGTSPKDIRAVGAPLPSTKLKLVALTGLKTARMHLPGIGITSLEDINAVGMYDASSTAELFRHPKGNLGRLGQIASFNAVDAAIAAEQSDIPTILGYNDGDEYFRLSPDEAGRAGQAGVGIIRMSGIHDELVIRPVPTLDALLIK